MNTSFRSIKLFREDLDVLVDLLGGSNRSTVVLADNDRTYGSFEEMQTTMGSDVDFLILRNEGLGVRLEFTRGDSTPVKLGTTRATLETDLVFYRTKDYLFSKRRPQSQLLRNLIPVAWVVMLAATLFFYIYRHSTFSPWLQGLIFIVYLPAVILAIFSEGIVKRSSFFLTLQRKHQRRPFFKRKMDDIVLMAVGSITGFFLGILGTLLVQHLTK